MREVGVLVVVCAVVVVWGLSCCPHHDDSWSMTGERNVDLVMKVLNDTVAYAPGDTIHLDVEFSSVGTDSLIVFLLRRNVYLDFVDSASTSYTCAPPPPFCNLTDYTLGAVTLAPGNSKTVPVLFTRCYDPWEEPWTLSLTEPTSARLYYRSSYGDGLTRVSCRSRSNEFVLVPREEEQ